MIKHYSQFITSKFRNPIEQLFIASLVISPLFLLTISGWMTRIVAVCALLAICVFYKNNSIKIKSSLSKKAAFDAKILCFTLALPLLAIFLGQSFRGHYEWAYYDSPAHILICIFILLATAKVGGHVVKWMSYIFPIASLLALANILIAPNLFWGATRLSTLAVDPLMFGSLNLTFGLLSLFSIKLHDDHDSKWLTIYKLIGFGTGLYLAILSGSRTGWLALPIVGFIWVYYDNAKWSLSTKLIAALTIVMLISSSYFLSSNMHQRLDATAHDLLNYQWNTSKPNDFDTIGPRISFARMAVFLLEQRPLSGWGDGGFESVINDPALNFSKLETKKIALVSGFHNDITANMVRSGFWGLIATAALFLNPALFFIRNMHSENKNQRNVAFLALAFLICQFVSSLSMEIFNLRYSASFFGLMITVFCGQILFYTANNNADFNGKVL